MAMDGSRNRTLQELVLPNIYANNEDVELTPGERRMWLSDYRLMSGKCLYWSYDDQPTLVTHHAPSPHLLAQWARFSGRIITPRVIEVPLRTFDLLNDVDTSAAARLLIERTLSRDRPVSLQYWKIEPSLVRFAGQLDDRGFSLSPTLEVLKRTCEVSLRLDSRETACAFLDGLSGLQGLQPRRLTLPDWAAVRDHVFSSDASERWVVKSTDSVAGDGVLLVESERDRRELANQEAPPCWLRHDGNTQYRYMSPPFTVEELVGCVRTNLSPTMDLFVDSEGVRFNVGLQLLYKGISYIGVVTTNYATDLDHGIYAWTAAIVGHELRQLGFRGYCNVDFVKPEEGVPSVVEINVRRSSPQDHFQSVGSSASGSLLLGHDPEQPLERSPGSSGRPENATMPTERRRAIEGGPGRWTWLSLDYVPASSLLLLTRLCRMKGRRLRCHLRLGSDAPDANLRGILLGGKEPRDIREVLVMSGLTDDTNIERVMAYCEETYPDDNKDRSRRPRPRHHPSGLARRH